MLSIDINRIPVDYDIYSKLQDLNNRLAAIEQWIGGLLRDKIEEIDKEQDLQNDRLNKLEYELLMLKSKTV